MNNGYFQKGRRRRDRRRGRDDGGVEGAAGEQHTCRLRLRHRRSRRSAPVPAAVAGASYAPVVERVMPAVVTIRVEKRASMVPTGQQQIPEELRRFFGDQMPQQCRGQRAASRRARARFRRHRQPGRLHPDQQPRRRRRRRSEGRAARQPHVHREGRRHRSGDRSRGREDRRERTCRRSCSATPTR